MLEKLYGKYFQKSRSFLYPALGIKRSQPYSPTGVYMSLDGMYEIEDCKLICCFKQEDSTAFKDFEETFLIGNPLYVTKFKIHDYTAYVFDYESYTQDWDQVILGHYSKLSSILKRAIKSFYGENTAEYEYIDSYMNPEKYFDNYAKLLDMPVDMLKQVGQLCDPADREKETLKIPVEHLENLKKTVTL